MVKKYILSAVFCLAATFAMAQPPSDNSPTYPQGATFTLSNGSTVTKTSESLSSSTQYYNVIQVTSGTLNLYQHWRRQPRGPPQLLWQQLNRLCRCRQQHQLSEYHCWIQCSD